MLKFGGLTKNIKRMTNKFTKFKNSNWLTVITILTMFLPALTWAQVNVTASAGTASASYLTLKESFDAINAGTHMGTISIDISASTTETATASLDASGAGSTSYSSITISTTGGPWTIGGAIVAGSPLINFNGADNITVNGGDNLIFSNTTISATSGTSTLKLIGDATNNTFNNVTFLGSGNMSLATNGGIVFISTGTITGNDNNSFQSCKFTAAGGNFPSKAIYGNGSTTNANIANANITINNCEIYDYFLAGGCAGVYASSGNTNWNITNNVIYQTAPRAMTSTMHGIYFSSSTYGNNVQITGNTIGYASNSATGTLSLTGTGSFQGIYFSGMSTAANVNNLNNNTISDISLTSTSGTFNGIVNASSASSNTINIIANRVKNIALISTTGTAYGISWGSATSMDVTYNYVNNISRSGAGTLYGIASSASSTNEDISNNFVYDLTSSASGASTINGIYQNTAAGSKLIRNNMVYNLTGQGGTSITGIYIGYGTTVSASGNIVHDLTNTGGTSGTINGIQRGTIASSVAIFKNNIYRLSTTSTGPSLSGIYISGGSSTDIYNNLIGNLTTNSANLNNPLNGIYIAGGTNANVYYNTVFLNASSSGALFGSSALYASSTPNLDLRNNILVNNSTPSGAGISAAYRRSSTTLTSYASSSNNNLFYAGTPSPTTAIFTDGTNTYADLATYKAAMVSRDQSSISENPVFLSTVGSSPNFLHINTGVGTAIESGAVNISGITDDYDANIRQGNAGYIGTGTAPDIGADEFEGTSPAPVINSVSITPTGNLCTAASRNITADVTPGSTPLTDIKVNYDFNGVIQTPITMTGGSFTTTSTWNATIPVAVPSNAMVSWTVTATDGTFTKSTAGTSYKDEPTTGVTVSASASPSVVCAGSTTTLTLNTSMQGTLTLGNTSGTNISTTGTPYRTGTTVGNETRTQYLILASELTAAGFNAGNLQSMSFNVSNSPTGVMTNFSIDMASTAATALTTTFLTPSFTNVYTIASYAPVQGVNTHTFSTPFYWDGVSNIVINICATLGTSGGGTTLVTSTTPGGIVATVANSAATGCTNATGTILTNQRPQFIFSGNMSSTPTNFLWSNGSVIGTTNPVVTTVTASTTYTATADIAGCPITATVSVINVPIPSAPSAFNSTQCGIGVSTASVSGGTNYNWYASPTSTTVLQSGSDPNYTTSIGATTTWYVASVNGTCESSTRTAVTTSVSIPDGVTATTSAANLCVGGANTITLTAVQSGTTNPYTFSWDASPASGSGMPTTMFGGTVIINPTSVGMYSYSVTATDGICTTISSVTVALNNLPDITNATATPSAICSGSTFTLNANSFVGGPQTVPTGYCTPSSSGSACITLVSFNTLTRTSTCETGFYLNVPSSSVTTNVTPGQTYTLNLTTSTSAIKSVWFDWNRDGVFSSTEWLQASTTGTTGVAVVTVPLSASGGLTKMRIRTRSSGNPNGANDACTSFASGEAEDYTINVQSDISSDYTWTWNPGALSGNSISTSATNTTTAPVTEIYTVTATSTVTGCSNTLTTSLVVNPIPATPIATDATLCGFGVPTASVTGGSSYNWYSSPTSTVVLQSGANSNFTTSINTTTTWYISNDNGTCESPRVALTQTVLTAPALSVTTPSSVICANSITTLSVTSTVADYDNYIWSPNSNLYTDAAATVPYTGGSASVLYFNSQVTGTSSYIINANNTGSGCVNSTSTTVSTDMPVIFASATPTLLCSGSTASLTANTEIISAGSSAIGSGTLVTTNSNISSGNNVSPFSHYYGGYKSQYIMRASELQATGLTAGNITALSLNVTSAGTTYTNFAISMAATTQSVATTTFNSSVSQVYGPVNVTPTVGLNMYTFTTPFNWDGVSNIVIQICWSNSNGGGGGAAEVVYGPTSYVSTSYYRVDNQTSSFVCGQTNAAAAISNRPNMILAGQKKSTGAGTITWQWNPGAINSNSTTVMPINTGTASSVESYTVTALDPATTCTNSAVVSVTVNPIPSVSITASSSTICAGSSTTLTASGAATYSWTTGGNTSIEVVTPITTDSMYVVTGTTNGCLNYASVNIHSNPLPTVNATASNTLVCSNFGESAVLTAVTSATSYTWSDGANTMTTSVTPTSGTTYTVTVNDGNCDAMATIFVDAQICMGINGVASVLEIGLYPNPTNGILNVNIPSELSENTSIEVFDGLGKLVMKENLSNDLNTINLSKLEDGIYFFKIINNDKALKVGKVVKQ
jgi:hypothetical protein